MYHLLLIFNILCVAAFAQSPTATTGRIYISKDRGVNWEKADKGFPEGVTVNAWVVQDRKVIAGTDTHGVFISDDHLKTWYPSSKGLPKNIRIISLVSFKNKLLAGTYTHGVFSSDDGGESWQPSSTGLKNLTVRTLFAEGPILLAGTNDGIYSSSDEGSSWSLEKSGLQVNAFSSSHNQIFAATHNGVFMTTDYGKTWDWIFKRGAIYTLTTNDHDIFLLDFNGTVYRSLITNFTWLKADLYLPFKYTFQLTPVSSKFFTAPWKASFKNLLEVNGGYRVYGLPEDIAFTKLLDTPYGLLAASGVWIKC